MYNWTKPENIITKYVNSTHMWADWVSRNQKEIRLNVSHRCERTNEWMSERLNERDKMKYKEQNLLLYYIPFAHTQWIEPPIQLSSASQLFSFICSTLYQRKNTHTHNPYYIYTDVSVCLGIAFVVHVTIHIRMRLLSWKLST